jgi:lipid II:glycine glycyltransferase (peptidoglycan interpeptide bridge formation enzyme)
MEIKEVKNKQVWEEFLLSIQEKTFLQSWNWLEFNQKMNHQTYCLGVFDQSNNLIGSVLAVKIKAKRGSFLLIQHGPNIKQDQLKEKILIIILKELKKIAKQEKIDFIRIVPLWQKNKQNQDIFKKLGFIKSPMHASAYQSTWKLDISLSEQEILKNMRKTTRYLIRQAEKNQAIEILKSNKPEDVEIYDKLNQEIARKKQFTCFSFSFSLNEFNCLVKDDNILLFLGKYQDKIVAAALVVFWSNIGFYHQAAFSAKYHKIPISYLLQWQAIKEAKKRNCLFYDFWGYVDPKLKPKHPWAGPSLFKTGFGGQEYHYLETMDLPLSKKYWLIYVFEKLRKIKRGL